MHLLATVALYVSIGSLLAIIFNLVEIAFRDDLSVYYSPTSALRWPLAVVVVIFSAYLWIQRFLYRDSQINPEKMNLRVRKWVAYLTLFLAAVLLLGNLITLLYYFLEGSFTVTFILKVLAVFVIGGLVFRYYLGDLRRNAGEYPKELRILSIVALFIVAGSVILGFWQAGSPFRQRLVKFDERKISDLSSLQGQLVYVFWQQKGRLPEKLSELNDPISAFSVPTDPQGGEYEYRKTAEMSFELCANFNLQSDLSQPNYAGMMPKMDVWEHGAGRVCFERDIDPEIYKPKTSGIPVQKIPLP